jgi:hypothetical protein
MRPINGAVAQARRWASRPLHRLLDALARRLVFPESEFPITLVDPPKIGSPIAFVAPSELWRGYTLGEKLKRVVARNWSLSDSELSKLARAVFLEQLYGTTDDAGEAILELMTDHWQTERTYDFLTDHDRKRADALRAYTLATLERFRGLRSSPPLNLRLLRASPLMCTLVNPMMMKVPITSLQFFIDIHVHFAFNEIRRSQHPHADRIIALVYDVLFLQQKTAVTLKALLGHLATIATKQQESWLIQAEIDAIIAADLLFIYAKASVEKTVALVGHALELELENKKTQKKRLAVLQAAFPEAARSTPYGVLLLAFISSDALEELNATRSGLLHKMGIAELQPHNYVGARGDASALRRLFSFLHHQHTKNTLTLLAALALLTDDLMRRDPPEAIPEYVLTPHHTIVEAVKAFIENGGLDSPSSTAG